ncbi:hypothetical protein PAMA_017721 [Pampus argenteus]
MLLFIKPGRSANQAQDLQDASQHSYYDSGLEESETPSSKSSSGPRIGPLALPEDHYERTTPDGSIGEMEHPENDPQRKHANTLLSDCLQQLAFCQPVVVFTGRTGCENVSQLAYTL